MRRHGVRDFNSPLSAEQLEATYPVLLRKAGYRTAFVGKYAVGGTSDLWKPEYGCMDKDGLSPGTRTPSLSLPSDHFDYWFGFPQRIDFIPTPVFVERTIGFLRSTPRSQPFCISLNFKEPHNFEPSDEPDYHDADVPFPPTFTREDFERQPEFLRKSLNGNRTGEWPKDASERLIRETRSCYRLISGMDYAVGRILNALKELKLEQNTVIVFTSDNGTLRGAHGLTGKWIMYEESIRVPLIIYDPRLPARLRGVRRSQMTLNIDLAPTMLSLGGVPVPARMQGRDLGPLLSGRPGQWRQDWYYEHTFMPKPPSLPIARSEGVRCERWKYIRYIDETPPYEQLFDLANDPQERRNLAGESNHQVRLTRMRARWQELRREAG
jgi:arylsulfatase A-like enzyme